MTPQELYESPYIESTFALSELADGGYNHFPEIETPWRFHEIPRDIPDGTNTRIEIRIHGYATQDSRRYWRLASVWYMKRPVMVIRNAGREGDDLVNRWITNEGVYLDMITYLLTLLPIALTTETTEDLFDRDTDIPNLTEFYGAKLKIGEKTERYTYGY